MPLTCRKAPASWDKKSSSVRVVAATDDPVEVFDFDRYEIVLEVLLMDGVVLPESGQVPLIDSHDRSSVKKIYGSARDFQVTPNALEATAVFADDADSKAIAAKVSGGHLDALSVGYRVLHSVWIPEGQSQTIASRVFNGPLRVTDQWEVRELSLVAIPADKKSRVRGENDMPNHQTTEQRESARAEERERCITISVLCRRAGCEDLADKFITDGTTIDQVRTQVMERVFARIENGGGYGYRPPIDFIADESDKRANAIIDGLCLRAGARIDKPAPGADHYRSVSLIEIARESLIASGLRVSGMSKSNIVKKALSERAATNFHFPYLLSNAAGKAIRSAFQEAPGTYEQWVKFGNADDFKEMSRNQLSEAPDLDIIPEKLPYTYGKFEESREVFQIRKYGKLFAITREAIINDDLNAWMRIPMAFSMSAKRTVNQVVYGILINNAAMADETPLFHSDHGNLAPTGAAPNKTSLSEGRLMMRKQTGLQGAILNVTPRFLITPAAHETTVDELLNSLASVDDNKNAGVVNPFYGKIVPVVEANLDEADPNAWYLAANSNQIDTVELAFLDGNREPYLETRDGWKIDGVEFKVRIEFGVKAIDHRGLFKNPGTP